MHYKVQTSSCSTANILMTIDPLGILHKFFLITLLKYVQVIGRLHIFPIFSFLTKMLSSLSRNDNIFATNENIGKICKRTTTWTDFMYYVTSLETVKCIEIFVMEWIQKYILLIGYFSATLRQNLYCKNEVKNIVWSRKMGEFKS